MNTEQQERHPLLCRAGGPQRASLGTGGPGSLPRAALPACTLGCLESAGTTQITQPSQLTPMMRASCSAPAPASSVQRCRRPGLGLPQASLYQLALYSIFSPLDLNSMWRICDRHLPNSSRTICSAKLGEQRSCSASSPWASRQAHVASTTSQEIQEKACLGRDTATQLFFNHSSSRGNGL